MILLAHELIHNLRMTFVVEERIEMYDQSLERRDELIGNVSS